MIFPSLSPMGKIQLGLLAAGALSISACDDPPNADEAHRQALTNAQDNLLPCARVGGDDFAPECWFERAQSDDGPIIVVHRPDGGFQRFSIVGDDLALVAADGADEVNARVAGNMLELTIGGYAYLFPARPQAEDGE